MKKIKFRAWDYTHKIMLEDNVCVFNISYPKEIEMPTLYGIVQQSIDDQTIIHPLFNAELMQSVGLKDKYGVEIYEGDVVEYISCQWADKEDLHESHDSDCHYDYCTVTYCEERACFCCDDDIKSTLPYNRKLMVIGNIYENPDLLN